MICPSCGRTLESASRFCNYCGAQVSTSGGAPPVSHNSGQLSTGRLRQDAQPTKRKTDALTWGCRMAILGVVGLVLVASLFSCGASPTKVPVPASTIPYATVGQWGGGLSRDIVISPKYCNDKDMRCLGEQLRAQTRGQGHAMVRIFDDARAASLAHLDNVSKADQTFHDKHFIGNYTRNSTTGYNRLTFALQGIEGPRVIVNYAKPGTEQPVDPRFQALVELAKRNETLTHWQYLEEADKMGRGTTKLVWVQSTNLVNFGFPYGGPQRASLELRISPEFGRNVILEVERGQFLCGLDGCRVEARFDQGKPMSFSASGPADLSTTTLFIDDYHRFLANLRKAETLRIEAPFYQEGNQVFEFEVGGLTWDDSPGKKRP